MRMSFAVAKHARNCDLIHANWTLSAALAQLTRFYHRCPIVVTVHGSDIYQAAQLSSFKSATRYFLNRCEKVVAVSESLAQETKSLGVPEKKLEVIPDGVDINQFRPSGIARDPIILFVGSLIERKGLRFLIKSMPAVLQKYPRYSLVLAGEGPQQQELTELAKEIDMIDRIKFLGAQPPEKVQELMRRARIFVLPSIEEGLGVVLLEALSSGTPCVATSVGGIPDLITSEVGVLVPSKDSSSLSRAIIALLADDSKWRQMSIKARQRIQSKFSWQSISLRLIDQYTQILGYDNK